MAKFQIGHSKVGGRKMGTPNKKSTAAELVLDEIGLNPLVELATIARDPNTEINNRVSALKELAQYCYPKRKAIDHNHTVVDAGLDEISDEELNKMHSEYLSKILSEFVFSDGSTGAQKNDIVLLLAELKNKL